MDWTIEERSRLQQVSSLLLTFAEEQGLATFDPFDIKETPLIVWSQKSPGILRLLCRKLVFGLELLMPIGIRKLFKIPKRVSPGAVGRLAQAYLAKGDIEKARNCLIWLLEHPGESIRGMGWGVPFNWSAHFGLVPANTAVAHTTQTCGHAFLDFFEATGETWAKIVASNCCEFLIHGLNFSKHGLNQVSLSYTSLDESEVVNISAGAAELLIRCGRAEHQSVALELANFVLNCQREDGGFPYHSPSSVSQKQNPIDHYHTCMVLGSLSRVPGSQFQDSYRRGLEFHLDQHFELDGCPKMSPTKKWPIDSYSAGMSLLVLQEATGNENLSLELRSRCESILRKLIEYSIASLIDRQGAVVYRIYPINSMWINSLRWSQALFCHAFFNLIQTKDELI